MSKVPCPVCQKAMRKDNLIRHIGTHKKELAGIMIDADIDLCRKLKLPFLYVGKKDADGKLKSVHCLHCGDYNCTAYGITNMLTTACIKHKDCIANFKLYEENFITPERDKVLNEYIMESLEGLPNQEKLIVEKQSLKDEIEHLKAEYDVLEKRYNAYVDKESDRDADKFKAADNVVNKVTDVLLRQIAYKLPDRMKAELLPYIKEVEAAIDAYEDN